MHYWIDRIRPDRPTPIIRLRRCGERFPVPTLEQMAATHDHTRPIPVVQAIREIDGILWVLTHVVDPKAARSGTDFEDAHLRHDTMIEAIDLESYRVIARAVFDELYETVLPDGRVGATVFEGGLVPVYQIMQMSLVGPRPG